MAIREINLRITGMTCSHCAATVTSAIRELDGVERVNVDYSSSHGTVRFNDTLLSPTQIADCVNETEIYHAEILPE